MTVEIGGQRPGYRQQFLLIKKEQTGQAGNFFSQLINGRNDPYTWLPIAGYQQVGDSMIVQQYIDEGIAERRAFSMSALPAAPIVSRKFLLGTDKYGRGHCEPLDDRERG